MHHKIRICFEWMYHTPMDSSGKYVYSRRSRGQIFCIEFQNDASREKNRFSPWYTRWWRSGWEGAGSIFFRFKHLFVFPESRYYSEFLIRMIDVSVSVYGIDIRDLDILYFFTSCPLFLKLEENPKPWMDQIFIPSSIFGKRKILNWFHSTDSFSRFFTQL